MIGWSGNTGNSSGPHLHFGMYRNTVTSDERNVTDPLGWRGSYPDPLNQFGDGHTASCLWRNHDGDPIACVDTIVEDAGAGFTISGTWNISQIGNGYHMFFRNTTTGNDHASWCLPTLHPGVYKFYAWIPWENATSQSADYGIWTVYGWVTVTINQQSYSDEWVHLGTYNLDRSINPSYNCVILNANTGEPPGTKLVGVVFCYLCLEYFSCLGKCASISRSAHDDSQAKLKHLFPIDEHHTGFLKFDALTR